MPASIHWGPTSREPVQETHSTTAIRPQLGRTLLHMADAVGPALIAAAGVLVQASVTYWISRNSAKDMRLNIDRELTILGKLDPESSEAKKLDEHVRANIRKLTRRDFIRDIAVEGLVRLGFLYVVLAAWFGLDFWRAHAGLSQRPIVDGLTWALVVPLLATIGSALHYFYGLGRLGYSLAHLRYMIWNNRRWLKKLQKIQDQFEKHLESNFEEAETLLERSDELSQTEEGRELIEKIREDQEAREQRQAFAREMADDVAVMEKRLQEREADYEAMIRGWRGLD